MYETDSTAQSYHATFVHPFHACAHGRLHADSVNGSNNDYFEAGNWELADGRRFTAAAERAGKAVCVIGETVRHRLFGGQNPVGAEIRLKQFACEVSGLLKPQGQSAMGTDQDDTVVMPLRTVQRRLAGSQDINRVMISVRQLIEAVVLASLGGLIGLALATVASILLSGVMQVPYLFNPAINLLSFLFSVAIGVIFGYFPALRAARLNPIEALRHE
jgi:ABC-type antimicrobial peptide transport system permease subunit